MLEYTYNDDAYVEALIQDGYSLDAARYVLNAVRMKLEKEFRDKTEILSRDLQYVSPYQFLADVFPDLEEYMVITSGESRDEHGTYAVMRADDLMDYQSQRNDVFVPPASFIQGYYSNATCRNLYAFVIDVDEVDPAILEKVLKDKVLGIRIPMPTYIVNSGRGLHLYYCFSQPIPFFKKNRPALQDIYKRLFGIVKKNLAAKADWHSLIQPFRLPGAMTKLGLVAVGFVANDKWSISDLATRVGVLFDGDLIQLEVMDQREYHARHAKMETGKACPVCGQALVIRKNSAGAEFVGCMGYPACSYIEDMSGNPIERKKASKRTRQNKKFYDYCLERVWEDTQPGRRYLAMVGLVIVAYKTGIEKERVEEDLLKLVDHYNQIGATFRVNEAKKALRAYNQKAIMCRSETLEDYFGWQFRRYHKERAAERKIDFDREQKEADENPIYRENLSTANVLDENGRIIKSRYVAWNAREERDRRQSRRGKHWYDNGGRPSAEKTVEEWRESHPDGTARQCIQETGLSKSTVYKWWKSNN